MSDLALPHSNALELASNDLATRIRAAIVQRSNENHHASEEIGFSRFILLGTPEEVTPAKYYDWKPEEPTDAMIIGTLTHLLEYEADSARERVAIRPVDGSGRLAAINTTVYKEWAREHEGKLPVSPKMALDACSAIDTLHASPMYKHWRASTRLICTEASFVWTDDETGLRCKIRPDALLLDSAGNLINEDLKTCADPAPTEFGRDIRQRNYARRMAWYRMGLRALFGVESMQILLAVGKEHKTVALHQAEDETLDAAEVVNREMLAILAAGRKPAEWETRVNLF